MAILQLAYRKISDDIDNIGICCDIDTSISEIDINIMSNFLTLLFVMRFRK